MHFLYQSEDQTTPLYGSMPCNSTCSYNIMACREMVRQVQQDFGRLDILVSTQTISGLYACHMCTTSNDDIINDRLDMLQIAEDQAGCAGIDSICPTCSGIIAWGRACPGEQCGHPVCVTSAHLPGGQMGRHHCCVPVICLPLHKGCLARHA